MSIFKQPDIAPKHNPVFTTADSLLDVTEMARHELESGELTANRLRILFGIYHNTLLVKCAEQT